MVPAKLREPAQKVKEVMQRGVTFRAVFIGLFLLFPCCYWGTGSYGHVDMMFSLLVPPLAFLILLAAINLPLRGKWKYALTEGEMVVIYTILSVGSAMGAEWTLITNMNIHSFAAYAQNDRLYREDILPYLPKGLFFTKDDVPMIQDYMQGGHDIKYGLMHLGIWVRPIAGWSLLFSMTTGAMLCINSMMREQWTSNEKLAFPIIQLPTLLTQSADRAPIWKSKFLWSGFAVMAIIDTLNGLNFLYPNVPHLNVRFLGDLGSYTQSPPWNAIGWTPIGLFPYMAALGLFMPTDLLFSAIFFFFFRKLQQIIALSMGYAQGTFAGGGLTPSPPYFSEQTWGAFLGLFLMAIWVSRGYLKTVWHEIIHGHPKNSPGMPHRWAFIGFILCLIGIGIFSQSIGLPFIAMVAYTLLFLAFSVALTRMRAQLGPPTHEMAFMGPNQLFADFAGTRGLQMNWIVRIASVFLYQNRIHRTHPMPYQLEGLKMGEEAKINTRALLIVIAVAMVAGAVLGNIAFILYGYQHGGTNNWGDVSDIVSKLGNTRRDSNYLASLMVLLGFAMVMMLDFIRFRVPGFPLHPVGYALSMNFGIDYIWFGLLIVWVIKAFVQRYYGLAGYEKLRAIALGILLAEFTAEAILGSISVLTHTAMYSISINGRLNWQQ